MTRALNLGGAEGRDTLIRLLPLIAIAIVVEASGSWIGRLMSYPKPELTCCYYTMNPLETHGLMTLKAANKRNDNRAACLFHTDSKLDSGRASTAVQAAEAAAPCSKTISTACDA
jgi:hypothetical protein